VKNDFIELILKGLNFGNNRLKYEKLKTHHGTTMYTASSINFLIMLFHATPGAIKEWWAYIYLLEVFLNLLILLSSSLTLLSHIFAPVIFQCVSDVE
jgi:hypothetical protein